MGGCGPSSTLCRHDDSDWNMSDYVNEDIPFTDFAQTSRSRTQLGYRSRLLPNVPPYKCQPALDCNMPDCQIVINSWSTTTTTDNENKKSSEIPDTTHVLHEVVWPLISFFFLKYQVLFILPTFIFVNAPHSRLLMMEKKISRPWSCLPEAGNEADNSLRSAGVFF